MPRLIVCVPAATALVVGCLAVPHPFSGSANGSGDGGADSGSTKCNAPATIDPFTAPPTSGSATCVTGTASAAIGASGGMLNESGSNSDALTASGRSAASARACTSSSQA